MTAIIQTLNRLWPTPWPLNLRTKHTVCQNQAARPLNRDEVSRLFQRELGYRHDF